MKASELMDNDLFMYGGSLCKFVIRSMDAIVQRLSDKNEYPPCAIYNAEPIPLTKEIMIKNDFNLNEEFQEWWKDGCPFNIMLGCDFDGECAWVCSELNQTTPLLLIKHVHILQHALRLCVINDLADNFKVE